MTWFGGFQCYYSSWTCGLTCEAWGWGRSFRSCYESWCETTVLRAWSSRGVESWDECIGGRKEEERQENDAGNVKPNFLRCQKLVFFALKLSRFGPPKVFYYCCVGSSWVLTAVLGVLWRQSGGKGVYVLKCVSNTGLNTLLCSVVVCKYYFTCAFFL